MKRPNRDDPFEKTTINTGFTSYTFDKMWLENASLGGILTGLVAEDLQRRKKDEFRD